MTLPNPVYFDFFVAGIATQRSILIPAGNYTGYTLATALTLSANSIYCKFEISTSKFTWWSDAAYTVSINICPNYVAPRTYGQAWQITGFDQTLNLTSANTGYHTSQVPINLTGATQIQLWTNLSVYNIPGSGRLASIPMSVNYNELLQYEDQSGAQPRLISDGNIQSIRICLRDEHSVPLANEYIPTTFGPGTYEYDNFCPPWEVVLSIERVGPSQQHSYSYVPQ